MHAREPSRSSSTSSAASSPRRRARTAGVPSTRRSYRRRRVRARGQLSVESVQRHTGIPGTRPTVPADGRPGGRAGTRPADCRAAGRRPYHQRRRHVARPRGDAFIGGRSSRHARRCPTTCTDRPPKEGIRGSGSLLKPGFRRNGQRRMKALAADRRHVSGGDPGRTPSASPESFDWIRSQIPRAFCEAR